MDKNELKALFADGKRPTGADFAALIDALWVNVEEQLQRAMKVVRLTYYQEEAPTNMAVGQYWYNPASNALIYMDDGVAREVSLRYDTLYVNEQDGYYPAGVYVNTAGVLGLIVGE